MKQSESLPTNQRAICKSCTESFDVALGHECPGLRPKSINERIENALSESRRWTDEAARLIKERDAAKPKPRDPNDPAAIAERAVEYLCSPAGQEAMRKAAADSADFRAKLAAARNIPWEKLHEPFTI